MSTRAKLPAGPPGPVTDLETYMRKLSAIVRETPALAPLAYTRAAGHVRSQIMRPENRGRGLELQAIACKLDQMAAEAIVPETDAIDAEIIAPWADDPSGEIATEFDGVVADFAAAKVGPDGGPASDLAASAQFAHNQAERRREKVTPVQITPDSCGSDGNQLSDTVLVRRGGTQGTGSFVQSGGVAGPVVAKNETSIIRWDGDENESLPCRVAISRLGGGANATWPLATDGTNSYSYRPFFHAFWGSGSRGQANEVWGDVGRGVQFTVNASHLYVNVGMDAFTATVAVGASVTYVAGAMYLSGNLGFFSGTSAAPVQRTIYIDELATSATSTQVVPLFAQCLLPPQSTALATSSGEMKIDFQDIGGNTLYSLQFINGTVAAPIPIGNDVYQIKVTNVAGGTAGYRLVFQLDL